MRSLRPGAQGCSSSGSHTAAGGQAVAPLRPSSSYVTCEGSCEPLGPHPRVWHSAGQREAAAPVAGGDRDWCWGGSPVPGLARWLAPWVRGAGPKLSLALRLHGGSRGLVHEPHDSHAPRLPFSGAAGTDPLPRGLSAQWGWRPAAGTAGQSRPARPRGSPARAAPAPGPPYPCTSRSPASALPGQPHTCRPGPSCPQSAAIKGRG